MRRSKVVYLEAFGERDMEADDPMREDSIFRIASQTKAIVSTASRSAWQDTHFYLPPAKRDRLATVYSGTGSGLERAEGTGSVGQGAYVEGPRKSFSGGAGLLSTVGDDARFLEMLRYGGELDGTRLLSPTTVELMTTSHLGGVAFDAGQGFGLGFSVVEDVGERGLPGSVGEFGWGGAYHSTYWVDPQEELVVVYMTQLIPAPRGMDDQEKVRTLVYQAIVD